MRPSSVIYRFLTAFAVDILHVCLASPTISKSSTVDMARTLRNIRESDARAFSRHADAFPTLQKAVTPNRVEAIIKTMQKAKKGERVKTINIYGEEVESEPIEYEAGPVQFFSLGQMGRGEINENTPLLFPGTWPVSVDEPESLPEKAIKDQMVEIERDWTKSIDRTVLQSMLQENINPRKLQEIDKVFLLGLGPFHSTSPRERDYIKRTLIQLTAALGLKNWMQKLPGPNVDGSNLRRSIVVRAQDPMFSPADVGTLEGMHIKVEPERNRGGGALLEVDEKTFFMGIGAPNIFEAWAALDKRPAITLTLWHKRLEDLGYSDWKDIRPAYLPKTQGWIDEHYKSFDIDLSEDFMLYFGSGGPPDRRLLLMVRKDYLSRD